MKTGDKVYITNQNDKYFLESGIVTKITETNRIVVTIDGYNSVVSYRENELAIIDFEMN